MAVSTRFPTTDVAVSGTWTTPTNVQADDAATASVTPAAKNTSNEREQGGYGFDGIIPSDATIDTVELLVEWHTVSPGICNLGVQYLISAAGGTYQENSAEPTSPTADVYDVTALRSWTRADLLDANLTTRLRGRNGNNTAGTYHFDYVQVRVNYTVPPPSITAGSMADADRNWTTPSQDIAVTFSEAMQITPAPSVGDTVAGLTAQVNGGANSALTYVSGNATASWKVRRAELIQQNDTVVLDYDQATGIILAVDDSQELNTETDQAVTNNLTKRIRLTLKDKNNATVASETVKYAVLEYDSGAPANANWMSRTDKGTVATDASGVLDVAYSGSTVVGSDVYVAVIRPNTTPTEAFVWHQAVD